MNASADMVEAKTNQPTMLLDAHSRYRATQDSSALNRSKENVRYTLIEELRGEDSSVEMGMSDHILVRDKNKDYSSTRKVSKKLKQH